MKKKILIIHEAENLCGSLEEFLNIKGYEAASAPNSSQGLKMLKSFDPDLLILQVYYLLDEYVRMDTLKEAKLIKPNLKIIASCDAEDTAEDTLKAGADRAISGFILLKELEKMLDEIFKNQEKINAQETSNS